MAQQPYRINGLGIRKAYLNDADYVTQTGSTPIRGDIYFSAEFNKFRAYNGSSWGFLGTPNTRISVRYVDLITDTLPLAAPFAPDGIDVVDGDLVLFAEPTLNAIYRAEVVAGDVVAWHSATLLQDDSAGLPVAGDQAWVQEGNTYTNFEYTFNGISWNVFGIGGGTLNDSILTWDGSGWTENTGIAITPNSISLRDNNDIDALPAGSLTISPGSKTNGTGNGGDVLINSGSSVGGKRGVIYLNAGDINLETETELQSTVYDVAQRSSSLLTRTLITSTPHNLQVGNLVDVLGVAPDYNGTFIITNTPSPNEFEYSHPDSFNEILTASAGTVTYYFTQAFGNITLSAEKITLTNKVFSIEKEIAGETLLDNQANTVLYSFPMADWGSWELNYQVTATDGSFRERGTMFVVHNDIEVSLTDMKAEAGSSDVFFNAIVNGINIEIRYSTFNLSIERDFKALITKVPN